MKKTQQIAAVIILVLAALAVYAFWRTQQPLPPVAAVSAKQAGASDKTLVDQSPLKTAQQLAQLAATHDERVLAQEALRLADYDVAIAFDNAIRQARLHPAPLSAEAKEEGKRLQRAQDVLKAEQDRAAQLTAQLAKAPANKKDAIQSDLVQVQADIGLAQDEVDDAKHDLERAGGDPVDRILAMKKAHEEAAHNTSSAIPTGSEQPEQVGLVHRAMQWRQLHQKQMQLWQAKSSTETALTELVGKHNALDAQIDAQKAAIPELAQHAKKSPQTPASPAPAPSATPGPVSGAAAPGGPDQSASLLQRTQLLADNQKVLTAFNQRIETKKELAEAYAQWIDIVAARQRAELHRALIGILIILVIALLGLYFSSWVDSVLKRFSMDRRQLESLRTVTRVSLQILALFLILLVIIGPPGQLGTFLGLAGAGLTVALKDFIVGFLGWFVLMGKHGMRLGDWVEINGVTGEVVEIGPFHTVLMETGNWTDSGHPTGRRVTFTNSFAIEGHFFNFSTSGQWLWDEMQIVLPPGKDPYAMVEAIKKRVVEATRESSAEAEREWRSVASSQDMSGFSVEPAISVKPAVGGVEVSVRYITKASERYQLRSKLNQTAVDLLGGRVLEPPVEEAKK